MEPTDAYFTEYENLEIHEIMLQDRPRQEAYLNAIRANRHMIQDKIVLDVGAGTGILSVFAAQMGAKMVYAIEPTNVGKIALQVVKDNNLTSIVKVIQTKIENFVLPAGAEKVDVIISEWMGFYLLHEGMLDSVIYARDNFLKSDGVMFPQEATIYVAPCSVSNRFEYWHDVDGVCMDAFARNLRQQKSTHPEIALVKPDDLLCEGTVLHWMDLQTVTSDELNEINFKDVIAIDRGGRHQGFCLWFDCRFPSIDYENAIVLSTSPRSLPTHWKQCVIILPEEACENVESQTPIAFNITLVRHPINLRKYNLEVELLDANNEEHPLPCNCLLTKCILAKAHLQSMETEQ